MAEKSNEQQSSHLVRFGQTDLYVSLSLSGDRISEYATGGG